MAMQSILAIANTSLKLGHTETIDVTVQKLNIPPSAGWRCIEREIFRCMQIPSSCMVHQKDIWIVSGHGRTFDGEAGRWLSFEHIHECKGKKLLQLCADCDDGHHRRQSVDGVGACSEMFLRFDRSPRKKSRLRRRPELQH